MPDTVQSQRILVTAKFDTIFIIPYTDSAPLASASAITSELCCYVGPPLGLEAKQVYFGHLAPIDGTKVTGSFR